MRRVERRLAGPSRPSSPGEIERALGEADVAYVGDLRPSPEPKALAGRLLRRLPPATPLFIDAFLARDAPLLRLWARGGLTDREVRTATRFDLELGVPFEPYARLLRPLLRRGRPVLPTECPVRADRATRRRRLGLASRRMAKMVDRARPRAVVMAGQAFLDPTLLPRLLGRAFGVAPERTATVLFGAGRARRLADGAWVLPRGRSGAVSARRVRDARLDLAATLWGLADRLLAQLGIDAWRRRAGDGYLRDLYPTVLGRGDRALARKVLAAAGLDAAEVRDTDARLGQRGSLYVPQANAILVGNLRLLDGAEEVAHFVNFALRGAAGRPVVSSFYQDVWDEAVGFLGSKLLHPARPGATMRILERARDPELPEDVRGFVLAHLRMERDAHGVEQIPAEVVAGVSRGGDFARRAHHLLGYVMGERLFRAWCGGTLSRRGLRRLFEAPGLAPGPGLLRYLRLSERLRTAERRPPSRAAARPRGRPA